MTTTTTYSPEEQTAARMIASLIYHDFPGGPDLDSDTTQLGLFGPAVRVCRDPYESAAIMMPLTGQLYDCPADAATAWEGLRMMTGAATPYARLDPLIREVGGAIHGATAPTMSQRSNGTKPTPPAPATEYVVSAPQIISAIELRRKQFPNLVWTVDGLIPEGVCLLAAKPKSRKSWLSLGIAVAVSSGGKAFNYYDVTPGRVLYLDLESNQRRMKSRLQAIINEREAWPENFDIATAWPRGDEGITLLDGYCDAHPDTRLIVIDIWARFRATKDPKADPYDQDYNALQQLNAWAEGRHVTVIVIHHTRKAKSDDPFEEISGTNGILGAVATALKLSTSPDVPDEQLLHMTGRDLIVDEPIALKWDNYTCQHLYVATGAEASSSGERRKILAVMDETKDYHLKELASLAGKTLSNLSNQLRRLMDDRLIERTGRGTYARVIVSREVREVGEVSEVSEVSEYIVERRFIHSDDRSEVGHEYGLPLQEAGNDLIHELHADSHTHEKTASLVDRVKKAKTPIPVVAWDTLPKEDLTGSVREPTPDDVVLTFATDGEFVGRWLVVVQHTGRICAAAKDQEKAATLAYKYRAE